ncbi:MAG: amidohydrolase, partial [Vicinamibacteria bacterium]
MIIDCHVHVNNYQDETIATLDQTLEALQREMRRNRVDMALILTSYKVTAGRPGTVEMVEATR